MSDRAIGSGKWKKLRITILDRDGWQCASCGRPAHTVDHIIPRVKGGDMWSPDNLQSMCKSCNSAKGGRFFSHKASPTGKARKVLASWDRSIHSYLLL